MKVEKLLTLLMYKPVYKKLFALFLLLIALSIKAQDSDFNIQEFYPIEKSHSYIGFSVKYMGYAMVRGRFEKFNGTFRYDENDITKTSVSLSVDASSIDTDHDWRDKDLKSENWLDVDKFPLLTFVSTKVISKESGFEIIGDLTIKAETREVIFKMNPASGVLKDVRGDAQVILTGETTINRSAFGVEGKRWSAIKEGITGVADEVNIEISILGKQIKERNFKNRVRNETKPPGKIYKAISDNGIAAGFKVFEDINANSEFDIRPGDLDIPGHMLLKEGKIKEALDVFKKNLEVFSEESRVYNSYAEALATSGNLAEARIYYQKALEMNPENQNASEILRHLD